MAVEYIHEFSTGITLERQNGQLVSKGFTVGEYMNRTMEKIPQCVERAIANKLFEVSKNSQSPEPTIVGRVVLGDKAQEELDWSVVAIVATGKDNYQRQTDLYRYFLCEGAKSLWKIATYLEDYRRQYGQFPVHKLGERNRTQPIDHNCVKQEYSLPGELQNFLNSSQTPSLLRPESKYDLNLINAMAEYKAKVVNSQLISWAWNVEAIEYPAYFLVIQAANQSAYDSLNNMRQFQASQPRPASGSGVDMAGIESSIKGLIGGGNIKPEWIQTIVQAKQQNQLTEEQWEKIFNDLGANSRSFSANIVRLLTLRAIILPKTLPHYLQYLDIQKPDQNPNQQQQISLEFQSQIRSYRNLLDSFLSEGAISVADLIGYHRRMDYVPAVAWLFDGGQPGLWLKHQEYFVSKVQEHFKRFYSTRKEYASLEKLFKEWGYQLYISSHLRKIANQTSQEMLSKPENMTLTEWLSANSLELIVQFSFLVIFLIFVEDLSAKLYILMFAIISGLFRIFLSKKEHYDLAEKIILGIISFISIIAITLVSQNLIPRVAEWANQKKIAEEKSAEEKDPGSNNKPPTVTGPTNGATNSTANSSPSDPPKPSEPEIAASSGPQAVRIPEPDKQQAISKFAETRQAIEQIVNELKGQLNSASQLPIDEKVSKEIVIAALQETLGMDIDIQQYENVIENAGSDVQQGDKWIEAIYLYQKDKLNWENPLGYILPSVRTTTDALKQDITKNPIFQFPTRTKVALEEIVKENNQNNQTVPKIKKVLNVPNLNYAGAIQGDPGEIKNLVEAIKRYQDPANPSQADGIIDPDKDTYKKLKNEVEQLLNPSGQ